MKYGYRSDVKVILATHPNEDAEVVDDDGNVVAIVVRPGRTFVDGADSMARIVAGTYGNLTTAVRTMRQRQKEYFASRDGRDLALAKAAEREVDRLLAELDAPAPKQGGLF